MRPIIHIGYHKTATTWFQDEFYPHSTSHAYHSRNAVKAALITPHALAFDPKIARQTFQSSGGRPPLLCEEGLSGYLHNGGLAGFMSKCMADRLAATFPDAHVIIALRSQPQIIAATYQQYVRGGGTYSARRYLFPEKFNRGAFAESYKVPRFALNHFEYDRLIAYYDTLFGRDNVHVFLYEDFRADRDTVLNALFRATGLAVDTDRVSAGRSNASYALPIVHAGRVLNHFTRRTVLDKRTIVHIPGWYTCRRYMLETLNGTGWFGRAPAPAALLGADIVDVIEDHYADSNDRLRALRPELAHGLRAYPAVKREANVLAEPEWRRPSIARAAYAANGR